MNETGTAAHINLSEEEYRRFQDLIQARTGLHFGNRQSGALEKGLGLGLEQANQRQPRSERASPERASSNSLSRYYEALQAAPNTDTLWEQLIEFLTIGETFFFRDPDQIEALKTHVLPDLIFRHRSDRTLRLWSAGCATGEEPYTLAILLHHLLPDIGSWDIRILATDINRQSLRQARLGRYRQWSFRQPRLPQYETHFIRHAASPGDHSQDVFELDPRLRHMVHFDYLNLIEPVFPSPATGTQDLDLIVCRSVTMYLPYPVIRVLADRFYQCLAPQGWLVVAPGEASHEIYHKLTPILLGRAIFFQKTDPAAEDPARLTAVSASLSPPSALAEVSAAAEVFTTAETSAPGEASTLGEASARTPDPAEWYGRGFSHQEERQFPEARQDFLACLKGDPNHVDALIHLSRLEVDLNHLPAARTWIEKAIALDPVRAEAHCLLGIIQQAQSSLPGAAGAYRKALYLDPELIMAHFGLASIYAREGRPAEATRHRDQAIRLASRLPADAILPCSGDLTAGYVLSVLGTTS